MILQHVLLHFTSLPIASLPIAYSLLHIVYCTLTIAYCLLPVAKAYYLMPIAHRGHCFALLWVALLCFCFACLGLLFLLACLLACLVACCACLHAGLLLPLIQVPTQKANICVPGTRHVTHSCLKTQSKVQTSTQTTVLVLVGDVFGANAMPYTKSPQHPTHAVK